ncbi:MAG: hypothetical protein LQ345_002398 [Seirophora villosa]|nr:MAG: hypothetical protein LQ345_002398 [Seirophora villosa]
MAEIKLTLNTTDQNWLLVFDNLDSIKIFNQYRPICDHGSILIAPRDSEIAATASVELPLKHLDDRDGTRLLLSYLKHNDQGAVFEQADQISNELGGLPLAIVHVAGYIIQCHKSVETFLKEYRSASSQEIDNNYTILYEAQYEKTYATVWFMALKGLELDARDFIDTLAFPSADKVFEEIFLADQLRAPCSFSLAALPALFCISDRARNGSARKISSEALSGLGKASVSMNESSTSTT